MKRGIVTISEGGSVFMPTAPIWMTRQEIADMLGVFGCYIRKASKRPQLVCLWMKNPMA